MKKGENSEESKPKPKPVPKPRGSEVSESKSSGADRPTEPKETSFRPKEIDYAVVTRSGRHFGQMLKEGQIIRDRLFIKDELMPKPGAPDLDNCVKIEVFYK